MHTYLNKYFHPFPQPSTCWRTSRPVPSWCATVTPSREPSGWRWRWPRYRPTYRRRRATLRLSSSDTSSSNPLQRASSWRAAPTSRCLGVWRLWCTSTLSPPWPCPANCCSPRSLGSGQEVGHTYYGYTCCNMPWPFVLIDWGRGGGIKIHLFWSPTISQRLLRPPLKKCCFRSSGWVRIELQNGNFFFSFCPPNKLLSKISI